MFHVLTVSMRDDSQPSDAMLRACLTAAADDVARGPRAGGVFGVAFGSGDANGGVVSHYIVSLGEGAPVLPVTVRRMVDPTVALIIVDGEAGRAAAAAAERFTNAAGDRLSHYGFVYQEEFGTWPPKEKFGPLAWARKRLLTVAKFLFPR